MKLRFVTEAEMSLSLKEVRKETVKLFPKITHRWPKWTIVLNRQ